nr:hypothetical protein Iba_chr08bCG8950 [Ipomoea batatas]
MKKKWWLTLSILQSRKAEKQRSTITQRLGNPDMVSPSSSSSVNTASFRASSNLRESGTDSEMPYVLDLTSAHALQLVLLINPRLAPRPGRNGDPNSNRERRRALAVIALSGSERDFAATFNSSSSLRTVCVFLLIEKGGGEAWLDKGLDYLKE